MASLVDLDSCCSVSMLINNFVVDNILTKCDLINHDVRLSTYYNEPLGHSSNIDYILVGNIDHVLGYSVLDPNVNLADHRPIMVCYHCSDLNLRVTDNGSDNANSSSNRCIPQLRWDHANLDLYRNTTDVLLRPLFEMLNGSSCILVSLLI